MNALNHVLDAVFDVLLWPLEKLGRGPALVIVAGVFGVLALLAFKHLSRQKSIARVKDKIKAHLIEIRIWADDPRIVFRAIGKVLWANVRYLALNLLPFVPLSIPFTFVIAQCVVRYGFDPAPVHAAGEHRLAGGGTTVRVALKRGEETRIAKLELHLPEGLEAVSPLVRIPSEGVAFQEIVARRAGTFELECVLADGARATKRFVAGELAPRMLQPDRGSGFWSAWLWPAEDALPSDSTFARIAVEYPDADLGWLPSGPGGVLVVFVVSSMLFGFLAVKPLKVAI